MKPAEKEQAGMRITHRDMQILDEIARMKMLTSRQIGALFFVDPPRYEWDVEKCSAAARRRIAILKNQGYLRSAFVPGDTPEKCYFLGPAAIALLKAADESEFSTPRYAERKETYALNSARHDLPLNSLIINLMLLEKVRSDLQVIEFRGEREMNFKFADDEHEFKPDAYLRLVLKDEQRACFFELQRGAVKASSTETKLVGYAEFVKQGMRSLLAVNYDPIYCWLVPDMDRLYKVVTCIKSFKIKYRKAYNWLDKGCFFISTDKHMDIASLGRGALSENPIKPGYWFDENLKKINGPFCLFE